MEFDYAKLNGRIREVCGTQAEFSDKMGLSERSVSMKLNNKIAFKQKEIVKAVEVLNIEACDIANYFFAFKVQNNELR